MTSNSTQAFYLMWRFLSICSIFLLAGCADEEPAKTASTTIPCPADPDATWCLGFHDGTSVAVHMKQSAGGDVDGTLVTGKVSLPLRGTRAKGNYRMHFCPDTPTGILHGRLVFPQRAEGAAEFTLEVDTEDGKFAHAVTGYAANRFPLAVSAEQPPALTGRWALFEDEATAETMYIAQHDDVVFIVPEAEAGATGTGIGDCSGFIALLESGGAFTAPTGMENSRGTELRIWGEFSADATWGTLTKTYSEISGYTYRETFAFSRLD